MRNLLIAVLACLMAGCANVPVESIRLNQIVHSNLADLHKKHVALVHAYFDQKVDQFDKWYIATYQPAYQANYEKLWNAKHPGNPLNLNQPDQLREYVQNSIAEYQELVGKIRAPEQEFIQALDQAYADTLQANETVTTLLKSSASLNEAETKKWNETAGKLFPQFDSKHIDSSIRSIQDAALGALK